MKTSQISFKFYHNYLYYFTIIIDGENKVECELFAYDETLRNLTKLLIDLHQTDIHQPIYFTVKCYYHEMTFKLSPCPPMDWLIFKINDIPYYLDRTQFYHALKAAIIDFLQKENFISSDLSTLTHNDIYQITLML